MAHGGTLFLDEVSEMPPEVQVKLLRVLETRALDALSRWDWPGNVRELKSAVHRAYVLSDPPAIQAEATEAVLTDSGVVGLHHREGDDESWPAVPVPAAVRGRRTT